MEALSSLRLVTQRVRTATLPCAGCSVSSPEQTYACLGIPPGLEMSPTCRRHHTPACRAERRLPSATAHTRAQGRAWRFPAHSSVNKTSEMYNDKHPHTGRMKGPLSRWPSLLCSGQEAPHHPGVGSGTFLHRPLRPALPRLTHDLDHPLGCSRPRTAAYTGHVPAPEAASQPRASVHRSASPASGLHPLSKGTEFADTERPEEGKAANSADIWLRSPGLALFWARWSNPTLT